MWRIIGEGTTSIPHQVESTVFYLEFVDGFLLLEYVPGDYSGDSEQTYSPQIETIPNQYSECGTQLELEINLVPESIYYLQ